jgi:hypothetical protein
MAHYGGLPADAVQFRDRVGGQDQVRAGGVLAQVRHGRGSGFRIVEPMSET